MFMIHLNIAGADNTVYSLKYKQWLGIIINMMQVGNLICCTRPWVSTGAGYMINGYMAYDNISEAEIQNVK